MIVLGADTHKCSHTIAAVAAATGELLGEQTVAVGPRGFAALLQWARGLDAQRVWALEDCRHVSGSLERFLIERGERVLRIPTHLTAKARRSARQRGKSDPIDALNVARAALQEGLDAFPPAHLDGPELDVRLLVDHRERLVGHRVELNSTLLWHLHDLGPGAAAAGRRVVLEEVEHPHRPAARPRAADDARSDRARRTAPTARAHAGDQPARARDQRARRADRTAAAQRAGLRATDRRQARRRDRRRPTLRHTRPARPRGGRRTDPRQLGNHPAPAARPRRKPPDQRGAAPCDRHPRALSPADPRLHRPPPRRGQDHPPSDPLPQALPRPPRLATAPPANPRPGHAHHQSLDSDTRSGADRPLRGDRRQTAAGAVSRPIRARVHAANAQPRASVRLVSAAAPGLRDDATVDRASPSCSPARRPAGFSGRYGDEERPSAASIRSSRLSS